VLDDSVKHTRFKRDNHVKLGVALVLKALRRDFHRDIAF
jgi:hypothetical protein